MFMVYFTKYLKILTPLALEGHQTTFKKDVESVLVKSLLSKLSEFQLYV